MLLRSSLKVDKYVMRKGCLLITAHFIKVFFFREVINRRLIGF